MKKVLSMFLVLAMMLSLVTVSTVASTAEQVTTGTKLENATQLATAGEYYMTGDVEYTGTDAITIANGVVLYGNGYTLKTAVSFAVAADATVAFNNVVFNTTNSLIGVVNGGEISFTDCTRTGDIEVEVDKVGGYIGELTGNAATVTFTNCTNNGSVSSTKADIGGFIGNATAAATIKFENCKNEGAVKGKTQVGGFAGYLINADLKLEVSNSYNTATVTSIVTNDVWQPVGGFVGWIQSATASFTDCANSGNITGPCRVAGLVAFAHQMKDIAFTNCTNSAEISSYRMTAGIAGQITGTKATFENCLNSGKIDTRQWGGGMASNVQTATFEMTNCKNTAYIYSLWETAGGMVAEIGGSANTTITNCENTGDVYSKKFAGGIVGSVSTTAICTITDCKNAADMRVIWHYAGGIVGGTQGTATVTVTKCITQGTVASDNPATGTGLDLICGGDESGTATRTITSCAAPSSDEVPKTAPLFYYAQNTAPEGDKQKVRFIALLDSLKYDEIGFIVTSQVNGGTVKNYGKCSVNKAYLTLKAGDNDVVSVDDINATFVAQGGTPICKYLCALTIKDVPTTGKVVFTVQTYGIVNGQEVPPHEFSAGVMEITYINGELQMPQ